MKHKARCQCIVTRENKVLMAKHVKGGNQRLLLPGGGMETNESYEECALRELQEECNVSGQIIMKTSEYYENTAEGIAWHVTFHVDIGKQEPSLGFDPEETGVPILQGIGWYGLNEICERDRAFLWAAGLFVIEEFSEELNSWGYDISYPNT